MSNVLKKSGKEIHAEWAKDLAGSASSSKRRISALELEQQTAEFIRLLTTASESAKGSDIGSLEFKRPSSKYSRSIAARG